MAYRDNDERNYRQDRSRGDHDNRMGRGGREFQQGGGYRSGDDRERYASYGQEGGGSQRSQREWAGDYQGMQQQRPYEENYRDRYEAGYDSDFRAGSRSGQGYQGGAGYGGDFGAGGQQQGMYGGNNPMQGSYGRGYRGAQGYGAQGGHGPERLRGVRFAGVRLPRPRL